MLQKIPRYITKDCFLLNDIFFHYRNCIRTKGTLKKGLWLWIRLRRKCKLVLTITLWGSFCNSKKNTTHELFEHFDEKVACKIYLIDVKVMFNVKSIVRTFCVCQAPVIQSSQLQQYDLENCVFCHLWTYEAGIMSIDTMLTLLCMFYEEIINSKVGFCIKQKMVLNWLVESYRLFIFFCS